MDSEASTSTSPLELERSISQLSVRSRSSQRSTTLRTNSKRKRLPSQASQAGSSASSIAPSDKSLTSFPSFSPDSPHDEHVGTPTSPIRVSLGVQGDDASTPSLAATRSLQLPLQDARAQSSSSSMVETLLSTLSPTLPSPSRPRTALFDDDAAPLLQQSVPGALHRADDAHIQTLIARHGAVGLVRSIAEDLATRDAQIAALRRRADARERTLRKIILECGLSNMDLESRLRTIEKEAKTTGVRKGAVEDLVGEAMSEEVISAGGSVYGDDNDATIRVRAASSSTSNGENPKGTARGWKDFLWGSSRASGSRANSVNGDDGKQTVLKQTPERKSVMQADVFNPPDEQLRTASRASSINSTSGARKTSLASSMLRLVAGGSSTARDAESRGRPDGLAVAASRRTPSASSAGTNASARVVSTQGAPRGALAAMRRTATQHNIQTTNLRNQQTDRWDTMAPSPHTDQSTRPENYGPVELDSILPPEEQPPTLTHLYNNYIGSEYLTDRFGFIYDQRRKKRQREAQLVAGKSKRGSRTEMLTNGRANLAAVIVDENSNPAVEVGGDDRPESPSSLDDQGKAKKWQDYLKVATFPTELLSHTPSISAPTIEVMEGSDILEVPKSPPLITAEDDHGFIPTASAATVAVSEEPATVNEEAASSGLAQEDVEPVRILLQQLSDVHDGLQRDKTVRWNDFLRKVRAERRREGEAANASAAAAAEARFQKATAMTPEARVADGELIGVANWANKGKIGRAKWSEFNRLVLGGIPVLMRAKIWAECSGATNLRVPGYYDDLIARPESEDHPEVAQQIRADINRTLTDNIFFRKGPGVQKLNEVLLAYSRRNPEVGYCQGMNLITANLLLIMPSAEEVFWILVCMVEKILPAGYYDHSLLASRADQQVLRTYVSEVLPRLSAHFDVLGIALETMTFQWFLSVFTDCLSAEALFRVWDVVLCFGDGSTFLFQVALALLKLNEQQLLACTTPAAVYTYINHQMTNHAISIDGLIQASEGLRRVVRREEVEARRSAAVEAEKELVREREERLQAYKERKAAAAAAAATASASAPTLLESATAAPAGETGIEAANADGGIAEATAGDSGETTPDAGGAASGTVIPGDADPATVDADSAPAEGQKEGGDVAAETAVSAEDP